MPLVPRGRARQALAIVEAGYSLEGSETEWLARVLEAARPDMEHTCGIYAFTCQVGRGQIDMGPYVEHNVAPEHNLAPAFAALVAELNRTVPGAFFDLLARSAMLCGAFTQSAPPKLLQHFRTLGRPAGIHDSFGIFVQDGEGFAVDITAPTAVAVEVSPRVHGIWKRVGVHLASAMRLRRRLRDAAAVRDALFSPGGALAHVEGPLRGDRPMRAYLAAAVRDVERARTARERSDPDRALDLWTGLVAGEWSLVDQWESDGRRYVAAYRNGPEVRDPRGLARMERRVLRYASLASSNKDIAFTLGLSPGAVASTVSRLLRKLRCQRRSDLLAFADPVRGRHVSIELAGEEIGVLSMAHTAGGAAFDRLSPAEREVASALVEGKTNAAIARARGTSANTVANQIRSIFDKLGVGSRTELARALILDDGS